MMKTVFLSKMKKILLDQKEEIVNSTKVEREIDLDGDETDAIQGKILHDINSRLNERALAKINQIDLALSKIANKSYGTCQDCDEDIGEKRLTVNPYFQTCISCAEDREMEEERQKLRQ